ncbi:MAG: SDR family oxidoreductase [Chloroflexota bacterium]|nr:SDR family oxidoreductase [Chloroflexota bacterium]
MPLPYVANKARRNAQWLRRDRRLSHSVRQSTACDHSLCGKGIYVNALAPGFVETPGLQTPAGGAEGKTLSDLIQAVFGTILLDRLGTPEEIAPWAVYLASDDSNFMVGQVISPNGGQVI